MEDKERSLVTSLDSYNQSSDLFTQSSKVNCDAEALRQIGSSITLAFWEDVKGFAAEEQRFESLRTVIFSKLNVLSKQILAEEEEWKRVDVKPKADLIAEIQECLYDYQLVENASQASLLKIAKTVFSFNKKRCARKVASVKVKPAKKQKLESSLPARDARKVERDQCQKSPVPAKHHQIINNSEQPTTFITSVSNQALVKDDSAIPVKKGPRGQRKSNRDKLVSSLTNIKPEIGHASPTMTDVEMVIKEETPNVDDSPDEKSQTAEKINSASKKEVNADLQKEEPLTLQMDPILSSPPRKRAAAVAAAMSVTDSINPPRSFSPRKKNIGNSNAAEEDVQLDEPTYCLCEQVSFGDMICCDFSKCPVEWFHFSCVNIKIKPKGKKWFCPLCRGDKPTILKSSLAKK